MGGIVESVFGSDTQQTSGNTSGTRLRKEDQTAIRGQQGVVTQQTNQFQNLLQQLQQQAAGSTPTLQTPQFGQGLDAVSQGLISQATQQQKQGLQGQQRQNTQQFRNNPAVAQILNAQAAAQTQLASNPLQFQAQQLQDNRQINRAQATNQSLLQQQQAGQAGRAEQAGFGGQTLASGGGLLQQLMGLGQLFGEQYGQGQQSQQKAGVLGNIFGGNFLGL